MKLSDLKNGAVVELRNGGRYLKVDDTFLNLKMNGDLMRVYDYTDDFKCDTGDDNDYDWDIVRFNNNIKPSHGCNANALSEIRHDKWTWERPNEILNETEKEYLKAVCKLLKVKSISKCSSPNEGFEFIAVAVCSEYSAQGIEFVSFPDFPKGTMFAGMEIHDTYTLKQLGLE